MPADTLKYSLLLDKGAVQEVERLRTTYGLKTKADVYDLGVRVLLWLTEQQANGYEIGRAKDDDFAPLLLPHRLDAQAWAEGAPTATGAGSGG